MLAVKNIGISFGALKAIDDVSFSANAGQILTVIGPNGAGKTTLFNVISGVYIASQGRVELGGEDVTSLAPEALAARGMSRTFQNLQIFQRMTVAQNVMVGVLGSVATCCRPVAAAVVGRQNRGAGLRCNYWRGRPCDKADVPRRPFIRRVQAARDSPCVGDRTPRAAAR